MSRLKSFKSASSGHDKESPTAAWASVVAMLAAKNKKTELESMLRRKNKKAVLESKLRRKQQTAKQQAAA